MDRTAATLPQPFVLSVSIWFYKLAMLLWALWLSFALLRWLPCAWRQFASEGVCSGYAQADRMRSFIAARSLRERAVPAQRACLVASFFCGLSLGAHVDQQIDEKTTSLPSETPETFTPTTSDFDYVKREEMIPMRDGVKLKTFILIPKGAKNAPILLTRTPYDAGNRVPRLNSPHLSRPCRRWMTRL